MKVKNYKNFGFIIDAIDLMPQKKNHRWLKAVDAVLAFVIVSVWAWIIYILWTWLRKS